MIEYNIFLMFIVIKEKTLETTRVFLVGIFMYDHCESSQVIFLSFMQDYMKY